MVAIGQTLTLGFLFRSSPCLDRTYGKSERTKSSGTNRWRSGRQPLTFHKFRTAKEYLDVARFDRVIVGADQEQNFTRSFDDLRRYMIVQGYSEALLV